MFDAKESNYRLPTLGTNVRREDEKMVGEHTRRDRVDGRKTRSLPEEGGGIGFLYLGVIRALRRLGEPV